MKKKKKGEKRLETDTKIFLKKKKKKSVSIIVIEKGSLIEGIWKKNSKINKRRVLNLRLKLEILEKLTVAP